MTVKKAEQKGNTGGLLAKLHYGVCEFLSEAIHTLNSATKQYKDISSLTVCLVYLFLSPFLLPLLFLYIPMFFICFRSISIAESF